MQRTFMLALSIGLPIGVVAVILGVILGFVASIWLVLWVGVIVTLLSAFLVLYATVVPMFRLVGGLKEFRKRTTGLTVIGEGIPWEQVEGELFRVLQFVPNASVEGDKVIARSTFEPYAILTIESPKYDQQLTMPVLHRLDFLNLWRFFEENAVSEGETLLVSYYPQAKKLSKVLPQRGWPHLAILVGPDEVASKALASDVPRGLRIYWNPRNIWER